MIIKHIVVTTLRVLQLLKDSPFTCAHEFFKKFAHAGGICTFELIHFQWTRPIRDTLTSLVRLAWNYYPSRTSLFDYWHFKLRQFIGTYWVELFWDSVTIFKHLWSHFNHVFSPSKIAYRDIFYINCLRKSFWRDRQVWFCMKSEQFCFWNTPPQSSHMFLRILTFLQIV